MVHRLVFPAISLLLLASGCTLPPKLTLADINPVRTYNVNKETLFEAVRQFATRESYKVERFELETGAIKAHKVLSTASGDAGRAPTGDTRHLLMVLKVKGVSAAIVELTASFSYANYQGAFTSEDEGMLVSEYHNLFTFLEDQLKK